MDQSGFVLAVVAATAFLSAAIISVFIIWLPVALLSAAFGASRDSGGVARREPARA
jgi:hypothetical protein